MATKINVGPVIGGIGISAVSLVSTATIEETGVITDMTVECLKSPCHVRELYPTASAWYNVPIPVGLGQAPGGVLLIPPSTNRVCQVKFRPVSGSVDIRLNKTAPFLAFFDNDAVPASFDIWWGGQVYSNTAVVVSNGAPDALFTDVAHGMENGEVVVLTGGTMPANFVLGQPYYVVSKAADTFKLSETLGGTPIPFASAGTSVLYSNDNGFLLHWI